MSETREKCKVLLGELVKLIKVDTKLSEVTTATTQELTGLLKLYRSYVDTMQPIMEAFPLELTQENVDQVVSLAQQQRATLDTLLSVRATSTYQECARRMDSLQKVFSSAQTFLAQNGTVAHLESIYNKKASADGADGEDGDEQEEQQQQQSHRRAAASSMARSARGGTSSRSTRAPVFTGPATVPDAVIDGSEPLTLELYNTLYQSSPELANAANEQARRSTIANETLDKCASTLQGKAPVLKKSDEGTISEDFNQIYQNIVDAIKILDNTLAEDKSGFVRAQRPDAVTTREQSIAIIELFDKWKAAITLASRLAQFGIRDHQSAAGEAFAKLDDLSAAAGGASSIEAFTGDPSTIANIESATEIMKNVEKDVHSRIASARSSADCLRSLDDTAVLHFTNNCKASDPSSFVPYLSSLLGWRSWTVRDGAVTEIIAGTGEIVPLSEPVPIPSNDQGSVPPASTWLDSVAAELLRTMKEHALTLCTHSQQVARGSAQFDASLWKNAESNVGSVSLIVLFTSIVEASVTVVGNNTNNNNNGSADSVNDVDPSTTLEIISQRPSSARRDSEKKQQASRLVQDRMSAIAGPFSAVTSPRRPSTNQTGQSSASMRMASRGKSKTADHNVAASRTKSSPSRSKRHESTAADIAAEQEAALIAQEEREAAALADSGGHPGASLASISSRSHRRACSISMSYKSGASKVSRNMSTTLQRPASVLRVVVEGMKEQLRKALAANEFHTVRKYQEWLSWARLFRQLWSQEIRSLASVEEYRWVKLLRAHFERDTQTNDVDIVFSFGTAWTDRFRWNLPQSFSSSSENTNSKIDDSIPPLATPSLLELFEKIVVIGMADRAVLLNGYVGSGRHTAVAQIASLLGVRVAEQDVASYNRDAASALRRGRALLQQGAFLITPSTTSCAASDVSPYVEMLRSLLQTDGLLFSDPRIVSFVDKNTTSSISSSSSSVVPPIFFKERLFHPSDMPSQLVHNTVETLLECCAFESCVRDASTRVRALISATEPLLRSTTTSSVSNTKFETFFGVEGLCRFASRARDNLWAGHCSTELHAVAQAIEDVWISRTSSSNHLLTSILVKTHSSLFLNSSSSSTGSSFALPVTGDKNLDAEIRRLSDPEKAAFVSICRLCDPTRRAYPLHKVRPVLVWGAAGSGKTNAIRVAHAALFDSRKISASIAHATTTVDGDASWKRVVARHTEENNKSSNSHLWLVFHGELSKQAAEFALNNIASDKNITVFIEADELNEASPTIQNFSLKCDTVRCEPVSFEAAVRAVLQSEPFTSKRVVSPELIQAFETWVEQDLEVSVAVLSAARRSIISPSDITVWTRVVLQGLQQLGGGGGGSSSSFEDRAVCSVAVWSLGALFLRDPRNAAWDNFVRERFSFEGDGNEPFLPIYASNSSSSEEATEELSMCDVCPTKPDGKLVPYSSTEHTGDDFFVPVVTEIQQQQSSPGKKNLLLPSSVVYTRAAVGTLLLSSHKALRLRGPSSTAKTALAEIIAKCVSSSKMTSDVNGSAHFIQPGTSLSDALMEATSQSATAVVVSSQSRSSVDKAVLRHLASPTANACASIGLPPVGRVILIETTPDRTSASAAAPAINTIQEGISTLETIHNRHVNLSEVALTMNTEAPCILSALEKASSSCLVSVQRASKALSLIDGSSSSSDIRFDEAVVTFLLQRVLPHYQDNAHDPFASGEMIEKSFLLPSIADSTLQNITSADSVKSEVGESLTEKYIDSELHLRAVEEATFAFAGSPLTIIVTPPGRGAVEVATAAATLLRNSIVSAPAGLQFAEWPEKIQNAEWLFVENGSVLTLESWNLIRRRKFPLRTIVCLRAAELYNCSASSCIPLWVREDSLLVKSLSPKLSTYDEHGVAKNASSNAGEGGDDNQQKDEDENADAAPAATSTRRKSFSTSTSQARSSRSLRGGHSSTNKNENATAESAAAQALFDKVSKMSDDERHSFISSLYMSISPECTGNETSAANSRFESVIASVRNTQQEQVQDLVKLTRFAADVEKAVQSARQKTVPQYLQAAAQYELKIDAPKTKIFEGVVKFNEYPEAPIRLFLRFDENRNKQFNNIKEAAVYLSTPAHEALYVPSASGGSTRVRMDGDSCVIQTGFLDLRLALNPTFQQLQTNNTTSDDASLQFTLSGTVTDPTQSHAKVGTAELNQVEDQSVVSKNWLRWGTTNASGETDYQEESRPTLDSALLSGSAEEADKMLTAAQALMKKTCSQVDTALREAVRAEKTALPNALASSLILAFASLSLTEREKKSASITAANPGLPDPLSPQVLAFLLGESTAEVMEWLADQRANCALPPGPHNDFIALLVRGFASGKIEATDDCHARLMIVDPSGNLTNWLKNFTAGLEDSNGVSGASVQLPSSSNSSSSSAASLLSTLPEAGFACAFGARSSTMGPILKYAESRNPSSPFVVVREDDVEEIGHCSWGNSIKGVIFDSRQSTSSLAATLQSSPVDSSVSGPAASQAAARAAAITKAANAARGLSSGSKNLKDWLQGQLDRHQDAFASIVADAAHEEAGLGPIIQQLEQGRHIKNETQAYVEPNATQLKKDAQMSEETVAIAKRAAALVAAIPRALTSSLRFSQAYALPDLLLRQACEKCFAAARREPKGFDLVSRGLIETVMHGILPQDRLAFLVTLAEEVMIEEGAAGAHEWIIMTGGWTKTSMKSLIPTIEDAEEEHRRQQQMAAEAAAQRRGGGGAGHRSSHHRASSAATTRGGAGTLPPKASTVAASGSGLRARPQMLFNPREQDYYITLEEWAGFLVAAENVSAFYADEDVSSDQNLLLESMHDPALLGKNSSKVGKWREWFDKPSLLVPGFEKISAHARFSLAWGFWSVADASSCTKLAETFVAEVFGSWIAKENNLIPSSVSGSDLEQCNSYSVESIKAALVSQTGTTLPLLMIRDKNVSAAEAGKNIETAFSDYQQWLTTQASANNNNNNMATSMAAASSSVRGGGKSSKKDRERAAAAAQQAAATAAASSDSADNKNSAEVRTEIVTFSIHEIAALTAMLKEGAQANIHRIVIVRDTEEATSDELGEILNSSIVPVTDSGAQAVPTSSLRLVLLVEAKQQRQVRIVATADENNNNNQQQIVQTLTKTTMPRCHISGPTSRFHIKKQLEVFCADDKIQSAIAMAPNDTWRRLIFLCGAVCSFLMAREAGVMSAQVLVSKITSGEQQEETTTSPTSQEENAFSSSATFDYIAAVTLLLRTSVSTMLAAAAAKSGNTRVHFHRWNAKALSSTAQINEVPWDAVRRSLAVLLASASPRSQTEVVEAYVDWLFHPATLTPDVGSGNPMLDIGGIVQVPMVSPCAPTTFANAVRELALPDVDAENLVDASQLAQALLGTRSVALTRFGGAAVATDSLVSIIESVAHKHITDFYDRVMEESGETFVPAANSVCEVVSILSRRLRDTSPCMLQHLVSAALVANSNLTAQLGNVDRALDVNCRKLEDLISAAANRTPCSGLSTSFDETCTIVSCIRNGLADLSQQVKMMLGGDNNSNTNAMNGTNATTTSNAMSGTNTTTASTSMMMSLHASSSFIKFPSPFIAGNLASLCCAAFADHIVQKGPEAALDETAITMSSAQLLLPSNNFALQQEEQMMMNQTGSKTFAMLGQVHLAGAVLSNKSEAVSGSSPSRSARRSRSARGGGISSKFLLRRASLDVLSGAPSASDTDLGGDALQPSNSMVMSSSSNQQNKSAKTNDNDASQQQQPNKKNEVALRFIIRKCIDLQIQAQNDMLEEQQLLAEEEGKNGKNNKNEDEETKDVAPFWGAKLSPIGLSRRFLLCQQLHRPPVALHAGPATILQGSLRVSALRNSLPLSQQQQQLLGGNNLDSTANSTTQQSNNNNSQIKFSQAVMTSASTAQIQLFLLNSNNNNSGNSNLFVEVPSAEAPQVWTLSGTHLRA